MKNWMPIQFECKSYTKSYIANYTVDGINVVVDGLAVSAIACHAGGPGLIPGQPYDWCGKCFSGNPCPRHCNCIAFKRLCKFVSAKNKCKHAPKARSELAFSRLTMVCCVPV
jgi:hypothetical protein